MLYSSYSFHSRRDFITDIFTNGKLYPKFPIYKTCLIIMQEHPELTQEEIVEKYFDPFKGCIISTLEFMPKNISTDDVEYIYKSENIPTEELLVCVKKDRSKRFYIMYGEYGMWSVLYRYTVENWFERPTKSHTQDQMEKYNSIDDIVLLLEKIPFMTEYEQKEQLGYMFLNVAINFKKKERLKVLDAIDEYGYTRDKIIETFDHIIKKIRGSNIEDETNFSFDCYHDDINPCLREFMDEKESCPICGYFINVSETGDLVFYDKNIQVCTFCKDPNRLTMTFQLNNNREKIYCHDKCREDLESESLQKFKVYNLDTVILYPDIGKMLDMILAYDFTFK